MGLRLPVCSRKYLTMHEGKTAAICPSKPAATVRLSQGGVPMTLVPKPM